MEAAAEFYLMCVVGWYALKWFVFKPIGLLMGLIVDVILDEP